MVGTRLDAEIPPTRLPRELILIYLLAPLLATPVLSGNFFELAPAHMLREAAATYLAFLTIAVGVHALYHFVMPFLLPRVETRIARLPLHVAMSGLVTLVVSLLIYPVVSFLFVDGPTMVTWTFRCVAITWTVLLPALAVEELRIRARSVERRLDEQRQAAIRAQLEAIQSRSNPHFLFNAMNTIASLVREDPPLAERTVERLSDVLRYGLQSMRFERVALGDEIAIVTDYLDIQRARFGARLRYTIDVEPGLERVRVPPLLLQPLVENAVLYGVAPRSEGGLIRVRARRDAGRIELCVEDDGSGTGHSSHRGSGTSLQDLSRRLHLLYGDACSLAARANEGGGFIVELVLPAAAVEP